MKEKLIFTLGKLRCQSAKQAPELFAAPPQPERYNVIHTNLYDDFTNTNITAGTGGSTYSETQSYLQEHRYAVLVNIGTNSFVDFLY